MINQKREENNGIKPLETCHVFLIIIDFVLFYLTFFDSNWCCNFINEHKGIPFTLFLFVTLWIIYLRTPKIEDSNNKQKDAK